MTGFRLYAEVLVDLAQIWDFIGKDNPSAADRTIAGLYDAFRMLARNPHAGHSRMDFTSRPFRFWRVQTISSRMFQRGFPFPFLPWSMGGVVPGR